MVLAYARVGRVRPARTPTGVFVTAYFAAWGAYGLIAYGVFRLVDSLDMGALAWDRAGPYVVGGAIAAAGLYQLTPLKDVCLRHCRSPIHFLAHGWRDGARGAFRMGFTHGLYCVGCCWGLMLVLFSLGVMSLVWMAAIAGVIFAEKVLPWGERLTTVIGVAFVVLGLWIMVAPDTVPGLTDPGSDTGPSMQMEP
jgi:predicted metal-binding membrane protein